MLDMLKFLDARLGEPSTYAGIAALLLAAHVEVDPGVLHLATLIGGMFAAGMAVLLSEVGNKPAVQVTEDVIAAVAAYLKSQETK